jgi:hypothetical protein
VKAAGGDQVPGLWYVDEESQGEHPTTRFALFVILHANIPSYANLLLSRRFSRRLSHPEQRCSRRNGTDRRFA